MTLLQQPEQWFGCPCRSRTLVLDGPSLEPVQEEKYIQTLPFAVVQTCTSQICEPVFRKIVVQVFIVTQDQVAPCWRYWWARWPEPDHPAHWRWTSRHILGSASPGPTVPSAPLLPSANRDTLCMISSVAKERWEKWQPSSCIRGNNLSFTVFVSGEYLSPFLTVPVHAHLNQQANDVMFNSTINSNHFYRISFSKNLYFLREEQHKGVYWHLWTENGQDQHPRRDTMHFRSFSFHKSPTASTLVLMTTPSFIRPANLKKKKEFHLNDKQTLAAWKQLSLPRQFQRARAWKASLQVHLNYELSGGWWMANLWSFLLKEMLQCKDQRLPWN